MITLRRAVADDVAVLTRFAEAAFRDTFERFNTPDDMTAYLVEAFGEAQQAAELADPKLTAFLAEHTGDDGTTLVGYVYVAETEAPDVVRGPKPIELKRLYVGHDWHGRGIAQLLMDAVVTEARARGGETLWLGVWEHNARAIAFYTKHGFSRVGEYVFVLGSDPQIDWLLARAL